jgi:hypothetical protein
LESRHLGLLIRWFRGRMWSGHSDHWERLMRRWEGGKESMSNVRNEGRIISSRRRNESWPDPEVEPGATDRAIARETKIIFLAAACLIRWFQSRQTKKWRSRSCRGTPPLIERDIHAKTTGLRLWIVIDDNCLD